MLSKFVSDGHWTSDLDNVWKKAVVSSSCRWSVGLLVGAYLLYRVFGNTKQDKFFTKIAAKQKARIINRKNLESTLRVDGQLLTPERAAIVSLDFPELQIKLRSDELNCVQVLQAFQAKALEVNEKTNAVVEFLEDALARAKYLDTLPKDKREPLHGIPISLKEHINIKGLDTTVGIPSNIGKISESDAGIVAVLKHLGAVPFCRTNLPQTNCSYECSNPIFGATLNPRDLTRGPGGSSGGEGALIAAGGSVMGFGSDLGGSVRIPAMYCGITSFKPTAGRIPITGQGSDGGLVGVVGLHNTIGFMGRSSKSIEECFKAVVNDPVIEDLTADSRLISIPWRDSVAKPGKKLKIGWYTYDGSMLATPGCRRAVHEAVRILQENGHEVVLFCPSGLDKVNSMYGRLGFIEYDPSTREMLEAGAEIDQQSLSLLKLCWKVPLCLKSVVASIVGWYFNSQILAEGIRIPIYAKESWQLMELNAKRLEVAEALLADWRGHNIDAVIAPGFAMPAVKHGYAGWLLGAITYTSAYNLLNFPAGSVPISCETSEDQADLALGYPGAETDIVYEWLKEGVEGSEGMPLNVQVIGLPWKEEVVLRVMQELQEKANPEMKLDL